MTNSIDSTTNLFYSNAWQVLEEGANGDTTNRYAWSPVYVDAMILRDRDTDANGTLDERLWVQQDANWNVTTMIDGRRRASKTAFPRRAWERGFQP